ncbi:MAG TPA: hypothetical protein DEB31_03525 [Clostridiales bacterium]|nr:hypothetical protein [Clostridiales bacterium]
MLLTEEQIQAASEVNLVDYCLHKGIPIKRFSGDTYRHEEYDSLKITGNKWKRHSLKDNGHGKHQGRSIQFLEEYCDLTFREAVIELLRFSNSPLLGKPSIKNKLNAYVGKGANRPQMSRMMDLVRQPPPQQLPQQGVENNNAKHATSEPPPTARDVPKDDAKRIFQLPPKHADNRRVFAYLTKTRGIHSDIVNHMIKNNSLYEDQRHNCVFVGYDMKNKACHAALRGTSTRVDTPFKGDVAGSKKVFAWSFTPEMDSTTLRVFESAIDAMSAMSMDMENGIPWNNRHYKALGCLAKDPIYFYLRMHPEIDTIDFCLDNDTAARAATREYIDELEKQGYACNDCPPTEKDYNADLVKKNGVSGNTNGEPAGGSA